MRKWMSLLMAVGLLTAFGPRLSAAEEAQVVLMSHDSFNISEDVLKDGEAAVGAKVVFLKSGDAGQALNQAILSKANPMADVFFGVDNTFMSRALEEDLFVPYQSPQLASIPTELQLDPEHRLLPVDYGDVCLNYHKAWFAEHHLAPPTDLEDLTKPEYKGLTVVENPATSSPGLAFLLATIGRFGDGWQDYWRRLRANDVLVVEGWKTAYFGSFSASSKGDRPIVVSYASSPPVEVLYSEKPLTEAPTAAVLTPGSAFRQIEFIGILQNAKHPDLAKRLVDFLLDRRFQEDIPLQMFVWPANRDAALPELYRKHAAVAEQPVMLEPAAIAANRDQWLTEWTEVVLH